MAEEERRKTIRRKGDECPHNCIVCYRYNLQMKWVIAAALLFVGIILSNKNDIGEVQRDVMVAKVSAEYTISSLNDIKRAMGLEIRMPPRIEALK